MTPRNLSTELTCILLSHILITWSQIARICCLCLDEIYISFVLETFTGMLFELHQDKTLCQSVVKVSTNVSIEWIDVPMVVSSANNTCAMMCISLLVFPNNAPLYKKQKQTWSNAKNVLCSFSIHTLLFLTKKIQLYSILLIYTVDEVIIKHIM